MIENFSQEKKLDYKCINLTLLTLIEQFKYILHTDFKIIFLGRISVFGWWNIKIILRSSQEDNLFELFRELQVASSSNIGIEYRKTTSCYQVFSYKRTKRLQKIEFSDSSGLKAHITEKTNSKFWLLHKTIFYYACVKEKKKKSKCHHKTKFCLLKYKF